MTAKTDAADNGSPVANCLDSGEWCYNKDCEDGCVKFFCRKVTAKYAAEKDGLACVKMECLPEGLLGKAMETDTDNVIASMNCLLTKKQIGEVNSRTFLGPSKREWVRKIFNLGLAELRRREEERHD